MIWTDRLSARCIDLATSLALLSVLLVIAAPLAAQSSAVPPKIACGARHNLALETAGFVRAWGRNHYGQLGIGTTVNSTIPVTIPSLYGVVDVACGEEHSLALSCDGTVWAWGQNAVGQLGDGTTNDAHQPQPIVGLSSVVATAAGKWHSLALLADGTLRSWGRNHWGQLGNGTMTTGIFVPGSTIPVVVLNLSGVVAIAGGGYHNLALRNDGTVWAWGHGAYGQLGDGTLTASSVPVQVSGLSGVVAIAAGDVHSMALMGDGTVWAWGYDLHKQIGAGLAQICTSLPVPAALPPFTVAIGAGRHHSLAVQSDGQLWSWGENSQGQLGQGGVVITFLPLAVANLNGVVRVDGGMEHSLALRSDGSLCAFGDNWFGQLGDGTQFDHPTPTQVSGASLHPPGILLTISQPGGAGCPVFLENANLAPGSEYYNIFSVDVGSGGPGSGPFGGLCITSALNLQLLAIQLAMPLGTEPFHFVAPLSSTTWGHLYLPQLTLDALCFEFSGGVVQAISPVARITVQ